MKKTIALLALLAGFLSHAQDKDRFNIGLHYNPNIEKNYLFGFTAGGDLRVRAVSVGKVNLGVGFSATYRESKVPDFKSPVILNPHIYSEFEVFPFPLKPYLGVGYAFYNLKFESETYPSVPSFDPGADEAFDPSGKIKYSGYSVCVGLRVDFAKILFADAGLTHYKFSADGLGASYSRSKDDLNLLHLGLGFRF